MINKEDIEEENNLKMRQILSKFPNESDSPTHLINRYSQNKSTLDHIPKLSLNPKQT